MQPSAEVRWFFEYPGARMGEPDLPGAVERWFCRGGLWCLEDERVDEYLVMPGCETASVKVRQGNLQVKTQVAPPVAVAYPGQVEGKRDKWIKWSREADSLVELHRFVRSDEDVWVHIRKHRYLRKISLDGPAPVEVDAATVKPTSGCGIEVTKVEVLQPAESIWWTLGFESFGEASGVARTLERVAGEFFKRSPPPIALDIDCSRSYPGWLNNW